MYLICRVTSHDHLIERVYEFFGWELLVLCHSVDKSCDHKHFDGGNIIFLICGVVSREHMFKRLCEFIGGSSSR